MGARPHPLMPHCHGLLPPNQVGAPLNTTGLGGGIPSPRGHPLWTQSCDVRPWEVKDLGPSRVCTAGPPALAPEECPPPIPQTGRPRANVQDVQRGKVLPQTLEP